MIPPESLITRLEDKTKAFINGNDANPPVQTSSIDEAKMWIKKFDFIETRSKLELGNILITLTNLAKKENITLLELIDLVPFKNSLSKMSVQHRNRLILLARFFNDNRPMTGISWTVGYEISAPKNEKIAYQLYSLAFEKDLSVDEIKKLADSLRIKATGKRTKPRQVKVIALTDDASKVMTFIEKEITPNKEKMFEILTNCHEKIKEQLNDKNAIEGSFTR
jgi:hypothetical protein